MSTTHIKCILKGGGLLSGSEIGRINNEAKITEVSNHL